MKLSKMKTLHLYLEKEKKSLENLLSSNSSHQDILRAETTIRTLQEQLQILCGDVSFFFWFSLYFFNNFLRG